MQKRVHRSQGSCLILATFLLTSLGSLKAQDTLFPFQVLDAHGAYKSTGQLMQRFDFVRADEVITVKGGTVVLVHYTGVPVEVRGDSIVRIKLLSYRLRQTTPRKITWSRPRIHRLFKTRGFRSRKRDGSSSFQFPSSNSFSHNIKDDLCLSWSAGGNDEYWIEFRSDQHDSIRTYYTGKTNLTIPAKHFTEIWKRYDALRILLRVDTIRGPETRVKLFSDLAVSGLFGCHPPSAAHALMLGYYYEERGNLVAGRKYYTLATQLSEDKVYRVALAYFEIRTERQ